MRAKASEEILPRLPSGVWYVYVPMCVYMCVVCCTPGRASFLPSGVFPMRAGDRSARLGFVPKASKVFVICERTILYTGGYHDYSVVD
jgi:hypothetical protein